MAQAFIGVGANLNNPRQQVQTAINNLDALPQTELVKASSLYGSHPQGPEDQPDYINAVAEIETELAPQALLNALQTQELEQGKVKLRHWGERVIDLDILLYDDLQLSGETLQIPHPQMHLRDFVLLPLQEIAADQVIPGRPSINELIAELEAHYVFPLVAHD